MVNFREIGTTTGFTTSLNPQALDNSLDALLASVLDAAP